MKSSSAEKLINLLREKGLVLATAESCTGGMIGQMLTAIPGASEFYCGGVISYTNRVKMDVLGVKSSTIEKYSEVSVNCAVEMARGVRALTGADVSVSVTGYAGPGGGTEQDPVGTVCFGLSFDDVEIYSRQCFGSELSRDEIRRLAAEYALDSLCDLISSCKIVPKAK